MLANGDTRVFSACIVDLYEFVEAKHNHRIIIIIDIVISTHNKLKIPMCG